MRGLGFRTVGRRRLSTSAHMWMTWAICQIWPPDVGRLLQDLSEQPFSSKVGGGLCDQMPVRRRAISEQSWSIQLSTSRGNAFDNHATSRLYRGSRHLPVTILGSVNKCGPVCRRPRWQWRARLGPHLHSRAGQWPGPPRPRTYLIPGIPESAEVRYE